MYSAIDFLCICRIFTDSPIFQNLKGSNIGILTHAFQCDQQVLCFFSGMSNPISCAQHFEVKDDIESHKILESLKCDKSVL